MILHSLSQSTRSLSPGGLFLQPDTAQQQQSKNEGGPTAPQGVLICIAGGQHQVESFQAPKSCPGRGAKAISLEEVDGGVRWERVGIQMKLERSTLDQICKAPNKILAHEGLLCKTRDEARVSPHCSLQGPGKTQGQSHPELPCQKET